MTAILCAVDGCTQSKSSKGWCAKHYQRWVRHGDPLGNPIFNYDRATPDTSIEDRFWSKVDKNGPVPINRADLGSCWIWTRALTSAGYGAFNLPQVDDRRRQDFAHIWSWKRYIGPIPKGYHLDHLCHTVDLEYCDLGDNCPHRACVNYEAHLELVTPGENTMRSHSWAATKKQQVTCLRGHVLVSPNLLVTRLPHRACKSCAYTYPLRRRHNTDFPNVTFDFQAQSDLIYNRIMGIIPEQYTPHQPGQQHEPAATEALRQVEIMIQNLAKL